MMLNDVAPIEALGAEAARKPDEFWKQLLSGTAPAVLEAIADAEGAPPIAPADNPLVAMQVPAVVPDFARLPHKETLADGRNVAVHFDHLSHSSRRPRALTQCSLHRRCRLDRFVHVIGDQRRCVAFLLAWHEAGARVVEDDPDAAMIMHRDAEIADAEVDRWEDVLASRE